MPSAVCCTEHCLVRCKLKLQFKPKLKKKGDDTEKLNVGSMCRDDVKVQPDHLPTLLADKTSTQLTPHPGDWCGELTTTTATWRQGKADLQQKRIISPCNENLTPDALQDSLKSAVLKTSADVPQIHKGEKQGLVWWKWQWVQDLLAEKSAAHQRYHAQTTNPMRKATSIKCTCSTLQQKQRNTGWVVEPPGLWTQLCVDLRDYGCLYVVPKVVCRLTHQVYSPCTVLMDRTYSLTILPSLLTGLSTSSASYVLTTMFRTLPSIIFLIFH